MDIIALIISFLALGLSAVQYLEESSRQKKEATLNIYNRLQDDVFSKLKKYDLKSLEKGDKGWDEVTTCLAKIENFSVGINTNIYSIDILNSLGGNFFVEQHDNLIPIINKKREEDKGNKHYDQFQKVVERLKKKRGITE